MLKTNGLHEQIYRCELYLNMIFVVTGLHPVFADLLGKYLELTTDSEPIHLADRNESATGQQFGFFKQGRPMEIKHRDTIYLQSWLHHYLEYRPGSSLMAGI